MTNENYMVQRRMIWDSMILHDIVIHKLIRLNKTEKITYLRLHLRLNIVRNSSYRGPFHPDLQTATYQVYKSDKEEIMSVISYWTSWMKNDALQQISSTASSQRSLKRSQYLDGCTVACNFVTFPRNIGGLPGSWVEGGLSVLHTTKRTLLKSSTTLQIDGLIVRFKRVKKRALIDMLSTCLV